MRRPSLSLILSGVFLAYIAHAIYTLSLLFVAPPCKSGETCLKSYLKDNPALELHLFASTMSRPLAREAFSVHSVGEFNYSLPYSMPVEMEIPSKTRNNGTLFLHIIVVPQSSRGKSYSELQKESAMSYTRIKMTQFAVPQAEAFNLLSDKKSTSNTPKKGSRTKTTTHLRSKVTFTMMTDDIELPLHEIPIELLEDLKVTREGAFLPIIKYDFLQTRHNDLVKIGKLEIPIELLEDLKVTREGAFLPIIKYDFLQTRHNDLVKIGKETEKMNVTIVYTPSSLGKLRLVMHVEAAMSGLKKLGFSDKDIDEAKGIYADTNMYLLAGTISIASLHLLFDFLAFKNDISFWRSKRNLQGLSTTTIVWRAFSQAVVFLYLLDEGSSLLVLIPAAIGTIIELWKSKKILRLEFKRSGGFLPSLKINRSDDGESAEEKTREFDAESMRYLSYLLYPLVIGGAIYSLLYQPHKSWYSWSINSLVNGVYAFGFLFMLPQLFVNYKLKSVAHLPWRSFMYKAFNTFIDDVFAFIITMPVAHRVACFRDDAVFLVYLYQRWLYPVDKSRKDTATIMEDPSGCDDSRNAKKNK